MKVIITDSRIDVLDADFEVDHENKIDWSCRLAALEACAWAAKRLGEEMEKSIAFYRTGNPTEKIGIE